MAGGNDGYSASQMCCWPGAVPGTPRDLRKAQGTARTKALRLRRLKGALEERRAPPLPPSWAARMTFYHVGKFWHRALVHHLAPPLSLPLHPAQGVMHPLRRNGLESCSPPLYISSYFLSIFCLLLRGDLPTHEYYGIASGLLKCLPPPGVAGFCWEGEKTLAHPGPTPVTLDGVWGFSSGKGKGLAQSSGAPGLECG